MVGWSVICNSQKDDCQKDFQCKVYVGLRGRPLCATAKGVKGGLPCEVYAGVSVGYLTCSYKNKCI